MVEGKMPALEADWEAEGKMVTLDGGVSSGHW